MTAFEEQSSNVPRTPLHHYEYKLLLAAGPEITYHFTSLITAANLAARTTIFLCDLK
jgi:hypothetical protein